MRVMKRVLALGMALLMCCCFSGCGLAIGMGMLDSMLRASEEESIEEIIETVENMDVSYNARELVSREPYVDVEAAQSATVMIYMCGSDLESGYGCATEDLNEMLYSRLSEDVSVVVETGGASEWQNSQIDPEVNQRYLLSNEGLITLEENLGARDMTDPDTLQDFVEYCADAFPSDRYILIFWDHGGGTLGGFGYDERFAYSPAMSLSQIDQALQGTGVQFDIVGFDACLMATLETAFVMEQYADHLLASQKEEPGIGWYYTDWFSALCENPAMSSKELGTLIVDGFVERIGIDAAGEEGTLSLVDLTAIKGLMDTLSNFLEAAQEELYAQNFAEISRARAHTAQGRRFENDYDHVDLKYLAENLSEITGAEELAFAVDQTVVYAKNTSNVHDRHGLNIYFPYEDLSEFPDMVELYSQIGFDEEYVRFLSSFVTIMAGGQPMGQETYGQDEWFDEELYVEYDEYYDETAYSSAELEIFEKGDYYALSLSDADWDITTTIEIQVLFDDGESYVDLGSDNLYEMDEDGDLIISFDSTWVSLDGTIVCFYFEEEYYDTDEWYTYGYVPVLINGEDAELIIRWDWQNEYGYVAGYRPYYEENISQKGLFQLQRGDVIEYLCDAYTYDLSYDDTYIWGDAMVYDGELTVSYEDIGFGNCLVYYCLTDVYGNQTWTEPVEFYD